MSGYHFALTCRECGGDVTHREGTEATDGEHATAEAFCSGCLARYRLDLVLTLVEITTIPDPTHTARARAGAAMGMDEMSSFA